MELKRLGFSPKGLLLEPIVVHFQAEQSNDLWQMDFTPSELKKLPQSDSLSSDKGLMLASFVDDRSGVLYQEYFLSDGRRTTARSKGKVERPFRTVQDGFETLYHFHKPQTLEEANEWLWNYLGHYNAMPHRSEDHSRLEDWKKNLPPEGYQKVCSRERFSQMAREPSTRSVGSDACITLGRISYQLKAEMAGEKVLVLLGLFDSEIYVEFQDKKEGPFYPAAGPIPLHTYRPFKKTHQEKKLDEIIGEKRSFQVRSINPQKTTSQDSIFTINRPFNG